MTSNKYNRGNESKPEKSVPDKGQSPDPDRRNPAPYEKGTNINKPEQQDISNDTREKVEIGEGDHDRERVKRDEEPVKDNSITP